MRWCRAKKERNENREGIENRRWGAGKGSKGRNFVLKKRYARKLRRRKRGKRVRKKKEKMK
jgi:hypothetical protein